MQDERELERLLEYFLELAMILVKEDLIELKKIPLRESLYPINSIIIPPIEEL